MTNLEIAEIIGKLVWYISLVIAAFFGMKSTILGMRKDQEKTAVQVERIETKVDDISETLITMRESQARHDQVTEDIKERVGSIEGRVTYLERRD